MLRPLTRRAGLAREGRKHCGELAEASRALTHRDGELGRLRIAPGNELRPIAVKALKLREP